MRAYRTVVRGRRELWCSCACSCGNTRDVLYGRLTSGNTKSCGCLHAESVKVNCLKHGKRHSKAWHVWAQMLQRCHNPRNKAYPNYGGRGITVDDSWRDFSRFLFDMGEPAVGMTLDRLDNDKGYSKENCRWASRIAQANNKRNNRIVEFNGRGLTVAQWSRELGIRASMISDRISKLRWNAHDALTIPKLR